MIKRLLTIGICIGGLMVCGGCDKEISSESENTSSTTSIDNTGNTDVVAKPNQAEKIFSVEQRDIYEEYEGYTIKKMYARMSADVGINIRKGPDETFDRIDGLNSDEVINVIGQCKDTGWYMILYSGGVGFVSDEYLVNKEDNEALVLGEECPYCLYVKTQYNGQVGWFYRSEIGWQCKDYENVIQQIVDEGYNIEHFPAYVGSWRDVGDVMWIGYSKE